MSPHPRTLPEAPDEQRLVRDELKQESVHLRTGLSYVRMHAAGDVEGVFGPESMMWRMYRELGTMLFSSGGALLLQIAYPAVSSGVRQHSEYARDPLARGRHTFCALYGMIFGPLSTAIELAGHVHARHLPVRGTTDPFPGLPPERYRALDPAHLLWVHSTLIHTLLRCHALLIRPLALEEESKLYEESKLLAALFGLPPAHMPPTYFEWRAYMDGMLDSPLLNAGPDENRIKESLFELPPDILVASLLQLSDDRPVKMLLARPWLFPWTRRFIDLTAAAMLPEHLREGFGLRFGEAEQQQFRWLARTARHALAVTPPALRFLPAYHRAVERVALARGERVPRDVRMYRWVGQVARSATRR